MDSKEFDLWRKSFFKDDFSVDQCLASYTQKADLESLMRDLKYYGHELQNQMSEILKNETEAIVNLAEHLTNLKSRIDTLSVPVSQLREEIRTLYDLMKHSEENYTKLLDDVKINKSKQNHMHLKMNLIKCCSHINIALATLDDDKNLMNLERLVNNYSFQKIYLELLDLFTDDVKAIASNVENKLIQKVNKHFLTALENCDENLLFKCLRMYLNLERQDEAHILVQVNILRPAIQPFFNENYLEKCSYNLDTIYNEVKTVLEFHLGTVLNMVKENAGFGCFNFVRNSFWLEFDKQSRESLPHITAPGNAELFQKRFTSTYAFLQFIAEKSGDRDLVHKDESFLNHIKRFNLPVYFEIIYQKIANQFESDLYSIKLADSQASTNKYNLNLKPTLVLLDAITKCFHKDVYIDQLASQFLKLAMMLISRYTKILETILLDHISSDSSESWDDFAIKSLIDLSLVESMVALENFHTLEHTIFNITNKNIWNVFPKVFKANATVIDRIKEFLHNQLVEAKIAESIKYLQQVQAIPRLYRRTNRSPPKAASAYMVEAIKPILEFHNKFKSKNDRNLNLILDSIISSITKQYLDLVQEVLMSVCKTEESLRRLKSRMNSGEEALPGSKETISDEMKIREQIKYDVGYFLDKCSALELTSSKEIMDSLKREVY